MALLYVYPHIVVIRQLLFDDCDHRPKGRKKKVDGKRSWRDGERRELKV
jgi:hypothetical protein